MKKSVFNFILLLILTESHPANHVEESEKIRKIDSFMTALYNRGQFTGAILVADHGKLIYKKAFGLANRETNTAFRVNTTEYIGSISKQFTAMGIMILKDKGKLNYDQHIRLFFPELPVCMEQVTIRHLLYHISGLALFDDFPDMTEKDVFTILLKQQSLRFTPGEKFEYCNAGYSLLGMIIEKITGESLHNFMATNIFKPLGMNQTSLNETGQPNKTRAVGYTMYGTVNSYDTYMGGNASIISTVEDLYKWDQELYHCSLVKPATLTEAFTPSSLVMKNSALNLKDELFGDMSYGFGWWISEQHTAKDLHHDGAFSGYISYLERIIGKKTTIIELSNLRNTIAYDIRTAILNILENKPYILPKITGSSLLFEKSKTLGIDSAISMYKVLHKNADPNYDFSERILNSYGYFLLRSDQVEEAIKLFKLNAEEYPYSSNVYDSLGDGYLKAGDKIHAIESYKKELALDPGNADLKNRIKTMESGQ